MTDWNSIDKITGNALAFSRLVHVFFGIYIWELVMFLDVDWRYIRNIKHWVRLPTMFHFLNRYCLLAGLISTMIVLDKPLEAMVNCQALYSSMDLLVSIALVLASVGFTMRIIALWCHVRVVLKRALIMFFVVCLIAQTWLLLESPTSAAWMPGLGCVNTGSRKTFSDIGHTFNTAYSFVLLAFANWRYAYPSDEAPRSNRVSLKELCWFGAAFLVSCVDTIFIWLNLNLIMVKIAIIPSTILISIASGRVIRLWQDSAQARERMEQLDLTVSESGDLAFQRLSSAPASHAGSYLGPADSRMRAVNPTIGPSIAPPTTYSPNNVSHDRSNDLEAANGRPGRPL